MDLDLDLDLDLDPDLDREQLLVEDLRWKLSLLLLLPLSFLPVLPLGRNEETLCKIGGDFSLLGLSLRAGSLDRLDLDLVSDLSLVLRLGDTVLVTLLLDLLDLFDETDLALCLLDRLKSLIEGEKEFDLLR